MKIHRNEMWWTVSFRFVVNQEGTVLLNRQKKKVISGLKYPPDGKYDPLNLAVALCWDQLKEAQERGEKGKGGGKAVRGMKREITGPPWFVLITRSG